MAEQDKLIGRCFREVVAGGYTRYDGTVEFYGRVQSLLRPSWTVLDLGAGRAAWYEDDQCEYRRHIRTLRGKVKNTIACDIDPVVEQNRSCDEAVLMPDIHTIPLPEESVDLIVSDYVFEHVQDPVRLSKEIDRVLRPGGWLCARTPNKYGYVSLITRLLANSTHKKIVPLVQPGRKEVDVFPTVFKMNTRREIGKLFPAPTYQDASYLFDSEPRYYFSSLLLLRLMNGVNRLLPPALRGNLFVFLKKSCRTS